MDKFYLYEERFPGQIFHIEFTDGLKVVKVVGKMEFWWGSDISNPFFLKPYETLKGALNTNPPFF